MIELRWLECDDKDLGAVRIEGPNGGRDYYAKLQFRQERFISGLEFMGGTFTDWQDVPLVPGLGPTDSKDG